MQLVKGIDSYKGWVLVMDIYESNTGDQVWYEAHHSDGRHMILQTSSHLPFDMTQERFEFLVRTGGMMDCVHILIGDKVSIPWNNESIDRAIEEGQYRN